MVIKQGEISSQADKVIQIYFGTESFMLSTNNSKPSKTLTTWNNLKPKLSWNHIKIETSTLVLVIAVFFFFFFLIKHSYNMITNPIQVKITDLSLTLIII